MHCDETTPLAELLRCMSLLALLAELLRCMSPLALPFVVHFGSASDLGTPSRLRRCQARFLVLGGFAVVRPRQSPYHNGCPRLVQSWGRFSVALRPLEAHPMSL